MSKRTERALKITIACLLIYSTYLFYGILTQPVVRISSASSECVSVEQEPPAIWSCENLPERYQTIWVK